MTGGALARLIRSAGEPAPPEPVPGEHCDLCQEQVPDEHRHLYDTDGGEVLCACRACSLLFAGEEAAQGRYRLVPQRRVRLPPVDTTALGVPVGLAYFVPAADGTVTAHYPSPAGATRWEADPAAWAAVVADCPALRELRPDVEALLVNTAWGARRHWIVPVDDCHRVVAIVRREWRGMSGGDRVWPAVEQFFAGLETSEPTTT
ncbi:DUF5947 family protein [Streptomyces sp. CC228A]|uniref:DUF5947 family protein n=1 Tax=Streptomyces sp. CC228A TaxID=2898186 RepID=UPI001F28CC86|nr:DUF5947 family protein [Streptomyces sp. CC228A]